MLVRVPGVEIDQSTRDFVLDIADHLYPGIDHLEQLPKREREQWIFLQTKIIEAEPEERESFRLSIKGLDEAVEAQVLDFLATAEALEAQEESTATERPDRRGMLPRLHGVDINESDEELALLLAEQFYPDLTNIDQIEDPHEKRGWITLAVQILRGQETVARHSAEAFSKVFQPLVDAQVADTVRKAAAEEREREERRAHLQALYEAAIEREAPPLGGLEEKRMGSLRERAKQRVASQSATSHLIPPPPPSPTYDRLFGNQIRWAIHVIRYSLQQRRLKLADTETK
jgi:hypothetical protein